MDLVSDAGFPSRRGLCRAVKFLKAQGPELGRGQRSLSQRDALLLRERMDPVRHDGNIIVTDPADIERLAGVREINGPFESPSSERAALEDEFGIAIHSPDLGVQIAGKLFEARAISEPHRNVRVRSTVVRA